MQIMWIKLLIQCFLLSAAECGSHSLEFLSTGRVQPGDVPEFEQLTVFDGVPISYCDSLSKRKELKPSLQSQNLPEDCNEATHQVLKFVHELSNNSVYIVQRRRGCTQSASGVVSAFEAWAVNGMDFMSFDLESQKWTSKSASAVQVQLSWNKNNKRNYDIRHFIRERCPEMIQSTKLRPTHQNTELRVFAKPTANTDQALLRCHLTTTDNSVSSVHLIGEGASKAIWISLTGPVPSADGSVILRLTAAISLKENTNKYGCTVKAGGHNFTVYWDGNTLDGRHILSIVSWKLWTIVFGVALIGCLILISCGIIYLLKCVKKKYSRVDPERMQQYAMMIMASYTTSAERREEWIQWARKITLEDQDLYDPEHYAQHIEGPLR